MTSLPRAMAGGSTALASEDLGQIWILGGSVEEDYYDGLESAYDKKHCHPRFLAYKTPNSIIFVKSNSPAQILGTLELNQSQMI